MIAHKQYVMSHYDSNKKVFVAWIQKDKYLPKNIKKNQ